MNSHLFYVLLFWLAAGNLTFAGEKNGWMVCSSRDFNDPKSEAERMAVPDENR